MNCHCNRTPCQCPTDAEVEALIGKPKADWIAANICTYHTVRDCSCWYWSEEQEKYRQQNASKGEHNP